jgi:hypothetical protein
MSYLLDQIKRASVNEAADILAAKYVESMEKKSEITKLADPQSASLYGAAAGAGVGGLGTLGLDYLSGRGVNARRALSGALIGALPGAAAGALADAYATPAAKDPKDPPSSPSLTLRKAWNFVNPLKIPQDGEEAVSGAAGAGVGWWGGSKLNNLIDRKHGFFNSGSGEFFKPKGYLGFLNTNNIENKDIVKALNEASDKAFRALEKADIRLASANAMKDGPEKVKALRNATDARALANLDYTNVGKNMPEIVRTPGMLNRPTQGIYERPGTGGVDPQKYRQVASGRSYILPAIGALFGYGGGVSANRAVSEPLHKFFSRRATDDVE